MSTWVVDFKSIEIEAKDFLEAKVKLQKYLENNQPEVNLMWKP